MAGIHRRIYYLRKGIIRSNFITIPSGPSLFLFTANNKFGKVTLNYSLQKELCNGGVSWTNTVFMTQKFKYVDGGITRGIQ